MPVLGEVQVTGESESMKGRPLPKSLQALEKVCKLLACTKCGKVPSDKVFNLGSCFHKYCGQCKEELRGKQCVEPSCKAGNGKKGPGGLEDTFSTTLLNALMQLKVELKKGVPKKGDGVEEAEAIEEDKDEDVGESRDLVELENEASAAQVKDDMPGNEKAEEDEFMFDEDFEEPGKKGEKNGDEVFEFDDEGGDPPLLTPMVPKLLRRGRKVSGAKGTPAVPTPPPPVLSQYRPSRLRTRKMKEDTSETADNETNVAPSAAPLSIKRPRRGQLFNNEKGETSNGSTKKRQSVQSRSMTTPAANLPSRRSKRASSVASSRASRESSLAREDNDNGDEEDDETGRKIPLSNKKPATSSSTKRLKMEAGAISAGSSRTNSPATTALLSTSFSTSTPNSGKIEKKNAKGETALHIACRMAALEKASQLIEAGGDVNARDYAGWGPLHEAINGKGSPSCKLDLVKLLCKDGSCNVNCPGMADETPLHEAARAGLKEILKYLLEHGASPNVRNESGKLPRDVAANEEIVSILSEAVASSPEAAIIADPVVLQIEMSKALLYFDYDVPQDVLKSVEEILNLKVSLKLRGEVTHIVFPSESVDDDKKVTFSFEYLHGIAIGAWMLRSEWIQKSLLEGKIISPIDYEIQGCSHFDDQSDISTPRRAHTNKELGNAGLFDGFHFYFYKNASFENIPKKDLISLVKLAGGKIVNREPNPNSVDPLENPVRFHAKTGHKLELTSHIIFFDAKNKPPKEKMVNMEHIKVLSTEWLIDSLGHFRIRDAEEYL